MKNIILFMILFVVTGSLFVPYWTGVEAEQQFSKFNQTFYSAVNLTPVDTRYDRGWFNSYAQSVVEINKPSHSVSKKQRLVLVHDIDHGFLPIQSTLVHTTLHTIASSTQLPDVLLINVQTAVELNGDTVSMITIPAQSIQEGEARLQWQALEGRVYAKRELTVIQTEIHSPQIQLDIHNEQIRAEKISLTVDMQPGKTNVLQSESRVNITHLQLTSPKKPLVSLTGLKLVGYNNIVSNRLTLALETGLQQIQIGADRYGPGKGHFELRRWHVPTLVNIKNTLTEIQSQGLDPKQSANLTLLRLMPDGLALLQNRPELAITHLNFNLPEGELRGTLQVKTEPLEGGLLAFALFNPYQLLKVLNAQLEMYLPQSLLSDDENTTFVTYPLVKQRLKTWLDQGLLIPTENQSNYYHSQMQLKAGIFQVNGEALPVTMLWSEKKQLNSDSQ